MMPSFWPLWAPGMYKLTYSQNTYRHKKYLKKQTNKNLLKHRDKAPLQLSLQKHCYQLTGGGGEMCLIWLNTFLNVCRVTSWHWVTWVGICLEMRLHVAAFCPLSISPKFLFARTAWSPFLKSTKEYAHAHTVIAEASKALASVIFP